jgi:hypothetical protein
MNAAELWCSTWNRTTYGLRACRLNETLKAVNSEIVQGRVPDESIIAVMDTLEHCLDYNRALKRIFKHKTGAQHAENQTAQDENTSQECDQKGDPAGPVPEARAVRAGGPA